FTGLRSDSVRQLHVRLQSRREAERGNDISAGRDSLRCPRGRALRGDEAGAKQRQSLWRRRHLRRSPGRAKAAPNRGAKSRPSGGGTRDSRDPDAIGTQVVASGTTSLPASYGGGDGRLPVADRVVERTTADRCLR